MPGASGDEGSNPFSIIIKVREYYEVDNMDNCIYIGNKPFMNYVTAVVTQATKNSIVTIKARGKYISRAVDVSEVTINRFMTDSKVSNIKIGSEEFENMEGKLVRVSTIELDIINPMG